MGPSGAARAMGRSAEVSAPLCRGDEGVGELDAPRSELVVRFSAVLDAERHTRRRRRVPIDRPARIPRLERPIVKSSLDGRRWGGCDGEENWRVVVRAERVAAPGFDAELAIWPQSRVSEHRVDAQ